jgi:hypothetical protein
MCANDACPAASVIVALEIADARVVFHVYNGLKLASARRLLRGTAAFLAGASKGSSPKPHSHMPMSSTLPNGNRRTCKISG